MIGYKKNCNFIVCDDMIKKSLFLRFDVYESEVCGIVCV